MTTFHEIIADVVFKDALDTFLRVEDITDIILIGADGGVRRIAYKNVEGIFKGEKA